MAEHENLKGAMFPDNNAEIAYKGTINVNGEQKYVSLIKAKTQNGEDIYEIAVSMGRVYFNAPESKKNKVGPDIGGPITIDGRKYKFGGWNNISKNGNSYLGCSLQDKTEAPF